ncbi:MAG TPA: oxygen-independent coproporphyrinogen III oxidase [Fibrobacteria bacterium]|nr:oxygen-independent coproporphyrinogen III oxidase [Fibrobacteria bacterium]
MTPSTMTSPSPRSLDSRTHSSRGESALDLLMRHDGAAPRYTSYPPANFFTESPDRIADELLDASGRDDSGSLSLYFHVPFCPRRCLFCGCHTEIGRTGSFIRDYMETLPLEFRLLAKRLNLRPGGRRVTQIHFGGGTPNSVPYSHLEDLLVQVASTCDLAPDVEIAMECDPGLVLAPQLEKLRGMGFNRISFGIQDIDPQVLKAVNRAPSKLPPAELVAVCRDLGFTGINLDLICGLPLQTPESFRTAVLAIAEAGPDRISLFPYAHVPWIKGHQTALEAYPAPDAAGRVRMTLEARELLQEAGYEAIGMDHYARPDDELAVAKRDGTLRRNFQGYAPPRAGQVHALGASAISQLHAGYLQNEKDLERYMARVRAGELPFAGGYRMRPRDLAAREVINALLCQGRADVPALLARFGLDAGMAQAYREESLERLEPYLADALATEVDGVVSVTTAGFPLSRRIAAAFDPLAARPGTARYSRAL